MSDQVNLLVCLSAQHSFIRITELHFFNLVTAIAPVMNVKLLSSGSDLQALVRLSDRQAADRVIQNLDGRSTDLGRVRVLLSTEDHVDYQWGFNGKNQCHKREVFGAVSSNSIQYLNSLKKDRSIGFGSYGLFKNGARDMANKTMEPMSFIDPLNMTQCTNINGLSQNYGNKKPITDKTNDNKPLFENKNCPNATIQSQDENEESECGIRIEVTHDDPAQLVEKKVLKAFRRFGRVFNMSFDENKSAWVLEYGSSKEVRKVSKVLANNKLFGYRLKSVDNSTGLLDKGASSSDTTKPSSENKIESNPNITSVVDNRTFKSDCSTIRIEFKSNKLSPEYVCVAIARIHKPCQLSFGFDKRRNTRFCLADFRFAYQAAEVLVTISQSNNGFSCRFSD